LPRLEEQNNRYQNPDNDLRGAWTSGDATCNKSVAERPNLYFAIKNPHTDEMILPSKQNVWRYEKSTFDKLRLWTKLD
jgi:adenine-specific DNA-methyltransferase